MSNNQAAFSYLIQKGYSPAAAAGIVGNLVQESGVNPVVRPGDNGTAHGIAQWRGDRYSGLLDYARNQGVGADGLNVQLDYLDNELRNKYGSTFNKVMSAQTPGDAAAAFALGYERPKGAETGIASNVDGWANRLAAANALTNAPAPAATSAPTQLSGASYQSAAPAAEGQAASSASESSPAPGLKQVGKLAGLLSPEEENPIIARGPMVEHLQFSGHIPRKFAGLLGR